MNLEPLTLVVGQPLRVAVYNSVSRSLRRGDAEPGQMLPSDAEMSAQFGVSRAVIREAMLLLEEDHLIVTRRGVGRFASAAQPRIGLERLRPLEDLLAGEGRTTAVRRVLEERQSPSQLLVEALAISGTEGVDVWESVISVDGRPIAVAFEAVRADGGVAAPRAGRTALAGILEDLASSQLRAVCDVSMSVLGEHRARLLGAQSDQSAIVLTQHVSHRGSPLLFAKHLVLPEEGTLTVAQTS
ncbi:hypothetical protein GCM10009808_03510 [Microbacterium sediminicola]|uniref:HTH gntR-type domain-containing protein n=1 Tax=Microbacterium sediminicola TaxID=415210 RepID=A0ABN2HLK7_9MICO